MAIKRLLYWNHCKSLEGCSSFKRKQMGVGEQYQTPPCFVLSSVSTVLCKMCKIFWVICCRSTQISACWTHLPLARLAHKCVHNSFWSAWICFTVVDVHLLLLDLISYRGKKNQLSLPRSGRNKTSLLVSFFFFFFFFWLSFNYLIISNAFKCR